VRQSLDHGNEVSGRRKDLSNAWVRDQQWERCWTDDGDGGSELDGDGNGIGGKRGCRVGQARKFIGMPGARGDSGGASQDVVVAVEKTFPVIGEIGGPSPSDQMSGTNPWA
jgi:hypothetical protein